MADATHISWTDETWNPIVGCSVLSPGCTNCYAMKMAWRLANNPATPHYAGTVEKHGGKPVWTGKVATAPDRVLMEPLHRRKPTMYFVNSMGDLFHEDVPDEWIDKVFAVMALAPQHIFQVLTKRADRMRAYLGASDLRPRLDVMRAELSGETIDNWSLTAGQWPLPNVWLGVSVEDQKHADERIPLLLDTPAAVRWISAEPLLAPIDLTDLSVDYNGTGIEQLDALHFDGNVEDDTRWCGKTIDWVVAGGESAQNKPGRPAHPDWFRDLRDQCVAAGVPFHFKQWGDWAPGECCDFLQSRTEETADWTGDKWFFDRITPSQAIGLHRDDEPDLYRVGARRAGRHLDGREWNEMPQNKPSPPAGEGRVRGTP